MQQGGGDVTGVTVAGTGAAGGGAVGTAVPGVEVVGRPVGSRRAERAGERRSAAPSGRRVDRSREPDLQVPDRGSPVRRDPDRSRDPSGWSTVAATAAHDLRAPLRALQILARQAISGELDPLELAHHVGEVTGRMAATLDSLLDIVDLGRMTLSPVEVDLSVLVASVESDLAPLLAERGARLETGGLPAWPVDVVLVRRALMNLVHNALVHGAAAEPVVRIEGAVVRDCLCLEVIDNGQGLPGGAENAESCFEPFTGDGVGLGLAICRGVAERHGGTITVPRTGPDGTTFRLVLPRETTVPA